MASPQNLQKKLRYNHLQRKLHTSICVEGSLQNWTGIH